MERITGKPSKAEWERCYIIDPVPCALIQLLNERLSSLLNGHLSGGISALDTVRQDVDGIMRNCQAVMLLRSKGKRDPKFKQLPCQQLRVGIFDELGITGKEHDYSDPISKKYF